MKKISFAVLLVAVIATFISYNYNVFQSQRVEELSDLMIANVEALTSGESGSKHSLECGGSGLKVCSGSCGKCNVTLRAFGNGKTAIFTCYQ